MTGDKGANRFIVTSVVRRAGQRQASGFVRVVDGESGQVLMKSPVPESVYRSQDPNPRGGLRGARGVSVWRGRLVLANAERLLVFDASWKPVNEITHPWMGGIHEVLAEEDGIWVTCTTADLLLKVSWQGQLLDDWEWRQNDTLVERLGFRNVPLVERGLDYRNPQSARDGVRNMVHLNGVSQGKEGLLLSFGRILSRKTYRMRKVKSFLGRIAKKLGVKGLRPHSPLKKLTPLPAGKIEGSSSAIIQLRAGEHAEVLNMETNLVVPNHNALQFGEWLIYNDTNAGETVALPMNGDHAKRSVSIPGAPHFVRGLARLNGCNFLMGSQKPAAVYHVDLAEERLVRCFPLEGEPNESVYDICVLPEEFEDPPVHLFQRS